MDLENINLMVLNHSVAILEHNINIVSAKGLNSCHNDPCEGLKMEVTFAFL